MQSTHIQNYVGNSLRSNVNILLFSTSMNTFGSTVYTWLSGYRAANRNGRMIIIKIDGKTVKESRVVNFELPLRFVNQGTVVATSKRNTTYLHSYVVRDSPFTC